MWNPCFPVKKAKSGSSFKIPTRARPLQDKCYNPNEGYVFITFLLILKPQYSNHLELKNYVTCFNKPW